MKKRAVAHPSSLVHSRVSTTVILVNKLYSLSPVLLQLPKISQGACEVRIDDARMIKVKREVDNKYYIDTCSASERERMFGLPLGYFKDAVSNLFMDLLDP